MFEKVNPYHPDKIADRIAGAIVDLCYTKNHDPKVAAELSCAIGDATVDGRPYSEIVEIARTFICARGGFEKLAEWGLICQ